MSYTRYRLGLLAGLLVVLGMAAGFIVPAGESPIYAQGVRPGVFRPGEKLSYNISFGKFANAAFAETHVISRGKLSGQDAVELRGRLRTLELVSAAFYFLDETRVTYAAPDSGLPLYITTDSNNSVLPKERVANYLTQPATSYDLLTLLFKVREAAGAGTFTVTEGQQVYTVTLIPGQPERVKTDAGEFDTIVSTVSSEYLNSRGIKDFKIYLSTDEAHVPVQATFKTGKGLVRALLSGISLADPEPVGPPPVIDALPVKPSGTPTPRPAITPLPYVENQPLPAELGFVLGEELEYQITAGDKQLARMQLVVKERKLVGQADTLTITAAITSVTPGVQDFRPGDQGFVHLDPDTLTPRRSQMRFVSNLPGMKQELVFDGRTGNVTFGGKIPVDAPMGTHSLLSLLYAMRSFNLRPSKNLSSPVNDTRVAVFWDSKAHIFILRPSMPEVITLNGEKVSAQAIVVSANIQQLDALAPKVWLGTEDRVPLRFKAGAYQADLVAKRNSLVR